MNFAESLIQYPPLLQQRMQNEANYKNSAAIFAVVSTLTGDAAAHPQSSRRRHTFRDEVRGATEKPILPAWARKVGVGWGRRGLSIQTAIQGRQVMERSQLLLLLLGENFSKMNHFIFLNHPVAKGGGSHPIQKS